MTKINAINLHQVIAFRDKIFEGLMHYVGITPTGDEFESLMEDLMLLLPEELKYGVVHESVKNLLNVELTKNDLRDTAWRLAGNIDKLKHGKATYVWQHQAEPEWAPIQVLIANRTKTWKGEYGYCYKLRVLSGPACPIMFWKTWPLKACSFIASKIGFSAPWKNYPYRDGHEFVGMRFMVEIDPKLCRDKQPGFDNIKCTGSLIKWNRTILRARTRIDPPCPFDFTHFCYQCPVGYDQCKAGTHPITYQVKVCSICNAETWHDPASFDVCVACRDNTRTIE